MALTYGSKKLASSMGYNGHLPYVCGYTESEIKCWAQDGRTFDLSQVLGKPDNFVFTGVYKVRASSEFLCVGYSAGLECYKFRVPENLPVSAIFDNTLSNNDAIDFDLHRYSLNESVCTINSKNALGCTGSGFDFTEHYGDYTEVYMSDYITLYGCGVAQLFDSKGYTCRRSYQSEPSQMEQALEENQVSKIIMFGTIGACGVTPNNTVYCYGETTTGESRQDEVPTYLK